MAAECSDIVVIGSGIAGASAAYEMAAERSVVLLEREEFPGYHSSGRSAEYFSETYGNRVIRALTIASRAFFTTPPAKFTDVPLLRRCGSVAVGREDQADALERAFLSHRELVASVSLLSESNLRRLVPLVRPGYANAAVYEAEACRIDVHALHQGYLRGFHARGGKLVCDADVAKAGREEGCDLLAGSSIVAPSGEVVARATTVADELIFARCDLELSRFNKENMFNFAEHRRIGHYKLITERAGAIPPPA